ncbi:ABC transporter ATP-binding protein [Brachybacterium sp. p3-SID1565]|uniref:ABC transporter ATP-binding protein n=1 Tax=Brachybacterium epidermidis TaxID=2781983 RepID=A0ABR9W293_9MICO|nr:MULTISPECIES: ABC transporter ATP-binding protein [Brachybacterium]MBE9404552.1 ABC transporter ATP-binding protein [Brachybacterium epidermidis]MCT1385486.1 ABC transporter ATP-binding protein [Brachybacterium sp. p3-SID1565]
MSTDEHVLEVTDLEITYGRSAEPTVKGISFVLAPGEKMAIVGGSGSGKSTTIAALLGLLPGEGRITGGSIRYRGQELVGATAAEWRQLRGRRIALVPQDPMSNLNPTMRVGDHIADALRAYGQTDKQSIHDDVIRLMTESGIPEAERRARQYPHEFSGGMRQRILIAIALAGDPDIVIADEPTSALDVTVQKQILDHLERLVEQRGMSLLFVTHDLGVAADRTDGIAVMHEGELVERGLPGEVLRHPEHPYTRELVDASPVLTNLSSTPPVAESEYVLEVKDLTKVFRMRGSARGEVRAVDGISFRARRGVTTAIIGESGSGKSTLASIVLGLETSTSGDVLLDGRSVTDASRREMKQLRRFTQPVFQDPYSSLNPMWTVEQIIREPLDVFGIGDRGERRERVRTLLEQVALPAHLAHAHPSQLSGGQRQRVAIARALSSSPQLLVCDEAVSALDVLVQDQILTLIGGLTRELGISCLFITHDLAVVSELAEDVVVMRSGSVVETGPVRDVITNPQHDYTRGLIESVPGREFMSV